MLTRWAAADMAGQHGRTALVAGANSGIGFHQALELARQGACVLLASRDPAAAGPPAPPSWRSW
jgi:NAD(P)-dependent dehydrogenase (short-subunit alcohol dehydrogenase family)